jgi:hypothetical protein
LLAFALLVAGCWFLAVPRPDSTRGAWGPRREAASNRQAASRAKGRGLRAEGEAPARVFPSALFLTPRPMRKTSVRIPLSEICRPTTRWMM